MYRFILFYFVLYICIYVAPWSCEARHLVPLYVHTCSGMTIKLNLTWLDLKTPYTFSTKSVCCDHTISTICVFTQYAVNYHVSKMLIFSFPSSLPKIMDLFSHIYKCLSTACQKLRPNVPNLKYSIKLLLVRVWVMKDSDADCGGRRNFILTKKHKIT